MSMTVLVVGGTGMLGAAVVDRLRRDGHRVRVPVRGSGPAPAGRDGVEHVAGDLDAPDTLRRALDGSGAVHVSVRGGPTAERFDRVEHRGTARLAELAARAGVARLTYVSHTLAAPDSPAADLRAKFRAEQAIEASGVPYTIFRPTYFMDTLPRQVRGGRAVVLGRQRRALHLVAATDFARLVSRCLDVPESAGTRLDVHGPEAVTIGDALRAYCALLRPDARVVEMPLWVMAALDRTVLRGRLRGTLGLMRAIQDHGERGDPRPAGRLLGPATTSLADWLGTQRPEGRPRP